MRKETILQFGEGGFLRGFFDWMLEKMHRAGVYDGQAVVVQPIREGKCRVLSEHGCRYTHIMRGSEGTEKTEISSISRAFSPYEDYDAYLKLSENPALRFIVSNTTEAGISYVAGDTLSDRPPKSFPAKVTALLWRRYQAGLPGFVFLPCELIDRNGDQLKKIVLQYAAEWSLPEAFRSWIEQENTFCCTLVDRIVTGCPREEFPEPELEGGLLNTSEYYHLWVIEGAENLFCELPLDRAGLNVILAKNLDAYRTRKVRILNGAHTVLVSYAYQKGFQTVGECLADPEISAFLRRCIFDEIIPTLELPKQELEEYAQEVLVRFQNPYIRHQLSAIALNSVSKFRVRVLPSILEYHKRFGRLPEGLTTALHGLVKLYQTDLANDLPEVTAALSGHSEQEIFQNKNLWGCNLCKELGL